MAKIRDDLGAVVYVAGVVLKPGATVPRGAAVGEHVLEQSRKPAPKSEPADSSE